VERDSDSHGVTLPAASEDGPAGGGSRQYRYLTAAAMAVFGLFAALLLLRIVIHILYRVPQNGAEAVILSVGWDAAQGEPIYNLIERSPSVFCVYNPVLPYLCGLTMYVFGPTAVPIRILVSLFYFGAGLMVYLFVRRETASSTAALVAALFLVTGRYLFDLAGSAVADYPALFLSMLGLYLWGAGGRSRYWAIGVFILAFFTKQTSVMAAAAAFSALFLERRRSASVRFFVIFLASAGLCLLVCAWLFGKAYFVNAYQYVGVAPFDVRDMVRRVGAACFFFITPLVVWTFMLARSLRDRKLLLPVLYVFFALLTGLSSGREGACRLYWCDFSAGMAIIVGLLWVGVAARAKAGTLTLPILAVFAVQAAIFMFGTWHGSKLLGVKPPDVLRREAAVAEAFKENSGIILCRYSGVEVGGRAENCTSDIFKLTHLIDAGLVSRSILLEGIRQERFSMVIMPKVEHNWIVFTDDMRQAVQQNYTVKYEAYGDLFFVPRQADGRSQEMPGG
jgi:hypothetical protein